jgi:hypothetical protein
MVRSVSVAADSKAKKAPETTRLKTVGKIKTTSARSGEVAGGLSREDLLQQNLQRCTLKLVYQSCITPDSPPAPLIQAM